MNFAQWALLHIVGVVAFVLYAMVFVGFSEGIQNLQDAAALLIVLLLASLSSWIGIHWIIGWL